VGMATISWGQGVDGVDIYSLCQSSLVTSNNEDNIRPYYCQAPKHNAVLVTGQPLLSSREQIPCFSTDSNEIIHWSWNCHNL